MSCAASGSALKFQISNSKTLIDYNIIPVEVVSGTRKLAYILSKLTL